MLDRYPRILLSLALGAACCVTSVVHAQDATPQAAPVPLRITPGSPVREVQGSVTGYQQALFSFEGAPGQEVEIRLDHPGRTSLYHNLQAPSGTSIFVGSRDGDRFADTLRERGRYVVQVYLMRNDARRAKRTTFTLRVRQTAPARPPLHPSAGVAPGFDCRKASGMVETTICRTPALAQLDARLDFVYRDALAGAPSQHAEQIRRDQRAWLQERNACGRERELRACLERRYLARIGELEPKR